MVLPWSIKTTRHVLELQRINYTTKSDTMDKGQVTLYDNIKVNSSVKAYWIEQAKQCKYEVQLNQLTQNEIGRWTKQEISPSWEDLDPYSSLEDVDDTSDDNKDSSTSEMLMVSENMNICSRLHPHKPNRVHSVHPVRKASQNI